MKYSKTLIAVVASMACTLSGTAHANPLEAELRNVLDKHPGVKAARIAIGASGDRADAARAGFLPRVNVSADGGRERVEVLNNVDSPARRTELNRNKVTVAVDQSLFNGGRTTHAVTIADLDRSILEHTAKAVEQETLLEAITAYLQVARYQTLIGLAKLNEETTLSQLEMESKRVEGGGGIAVDVLQARTRLQIVRERRVFYEQGLRDAAATYEQVFGRAPDYSTLQDVKPMDARLPSNLQLALALAMEKNPRLKVSALQRQRAQTQIDLERSNFAPSVGLTLAQSADRNVLQVPKRDETSLLLKFNWTLYSGGDTKARTSAAVKDLAEMSERDDLSKNKARESVRVTWNQLVNGGERLDLLDSAAAISRDVMTNRKRLRDAGKESAVIVLDAEVEYYGVLASKVNAMYDTRIGSYRLLANIGELTPEVIGLGGKFLVPVEPLVVNLDQISAPRQK